MPVHDYNYKNKNSADAHAILITGASGFVGKNIFLNPSIKDDISDEFKDFNFKNLKLFGTYSGNKRRPKPGTSPKPGSGSVSGSVSNFNFDPDFNPDYLHLDILDKKSIDNVLTLTAPRYIIHLAAQSFVPRSYENPKETYDINFYGVFNLLESLKETGFKGRLLYISSSDVYGSFEPSGLPLKETAPLSPKSPYAASKGAAELLCAQYANAFNIDIVTARPFNHIGLYQDDRFVVSDFAKQVALIALGKKEPLMKVGNIETSRDFLDVKDVIRAYYLLLLKGRTKEIYNVCSGASVKISYILKKLISFSGKDIVVKIDPKRLRSYDIPDIYGDNSKLKSHTGFSPVHNIEDTLLELYNYYLD